MKQSESALVNPLFQIICIIITSCVIACVLYKPIKEYRPLDEMCRIHNYDVTQSEVKDKKVEAGMYVQCFLSSDISKGTASVDAVVWFAYDPRNVKKNDFDDFFIKQARVKDKRLVGTKKVSETHEISYWHIIMYSTFDLNFKEFPLDDHVLTFSVCIPRSDLNIYVRPENFHVINDSGLNGWKVVTTQAYRADGVCGKTGYDKELDGEELLFSAGISNSGHSSVMSLIIPLFILFFISLFSLSFPTDKGTDLAINMSLAYVAFRSLIEDSAPHVTYLTMCDILFLFFLASALIIFIIQCCHSYLPWYIKYATVIFLHISCIGVVYYSL